MERRLLLVFALTFLIIMLFQPLLKKYGPQAPPQPEKAAGLHPAGQPGTAVPTQAAENDASLRVAGGTGQSPVTTRASATQMATSESETVVENDVYRIVFTNRGGRVDNMGVEKKHR